jgi:hypothetical protein
MASIMQRAIDIDETNHTTQEERINALLLENKGLKEILAVHEHMHQQKPLPTIISEVIQYSFSLIISRVELEKVRKWSKKRFLIARKMKDITLIFYY